MRPVHLMCSSQRSNPDNNAYLNGFKDQTPLPGPEGGSLAALLDQWVFALVLAGLIGSAAGSAGGYLRRCSKMRKLLACAR